MKIIDIEKLRSFSKKDFTKRFELYKQFLNFLGNPEKRLRTVIIAGSSGKGSTAEYLSQFLITHKIKTGLYTSPHLFKINERIKINNKPISNKKYENLKNYILQKLEEFNKKNHLNYNATFFEIVTIIAFLYFLENKVDIAVLEVGLGGRLDATNVTKPIWNIITPICKDHTNFLGDTIKKIAKEKADIIKEKSRTLLLSNDKSVIKIVKEKCKDVGSQLYIENSDFKIKILEVIESKIIFQYIGQYYTANFQGKNISTGALKSIGAAIFSANWLIKNKFNKSIDVSLIQNVIYNFKFPARFQIEQYKNKRVIIDGGHNECAITEFIKSLNLYNYHGGDIIFTIMNDKEADDILKKLSQISDRIILTQIGHPRERDIMSTYEIASKYFSNVTMAGGIENAINLCRKNKDKHIYVIGSFYLCIEALKFLGRM